MKKIERAAPVNWYDPTQLADTALRSTLSEIFATYSDKRETYSHTAIPEPTLVGEGKEEVWVDYAADTGDGFDATYSVAYCLANPEIISAAHKDWKVADALILGGDQVYPTPGVDEYERRFKNVFEAAFPRNSLVDAPRLFAIPGNHDWYDGLNKFLKIFCQRRKIGGWQTAQERSYFAVTLPHNVWVFGIDIQLEGAIDDLQLQYFEGVMKKIANDAKIILCTAEPNWYQCTEDVKSTQFRTLDYFIRRIIYQEGVTNEQEQKNAKLILVLTGDSHHYAAYKAEVDYTTNIDKPETQKKWETLFITAGGGGAFLHPTHNLHDKNEAGENELRYEFPEKTKDEGRSFKSKINWNFTYKECYPAKADSKKMTWGNLKFGFQSLLLSALFGFLYAAVFLSVENYSIVNDAAYNPIVSFSSHLAKQPLANVTWEVTKEVLANPVALVFSLFFVTIFFVVATLYKRKPNLMIGLGITHLLVQFILMCTFIGLSIHCISHCFFSDDTNKMLSPGFRVCAFAIIFGIGFLVSGFVMGIYFIIANLGFKVHDNEAFSSLSVQDYKNFLRLKITKEELTVYVVRIKKVAKDWREKTSADKTVSDLVPKKSPLQFEEVTSHIFKNNNWS
ncbi:MAG: metallophosphoesterase [Bacteroidetes bacterium]|nr:metallophosphoesterase [Bacteroidota bacterium]